MNKIYIKIEFKFSISLPFKITIGLKILGSDFIFKKKAFKKRIISYIFRH